MIITARLLLTLPLLLTVAYAQVEGGYEALEALTEAALFAFAVLASGMSAGLVALAGMTGWALGRWA